MKSEWIFDEPILVTQPTLPPKELYKSYIDKIWENKWLTNSGPLHEEFKRKLQEYLGAKNTELYTNGHLALEIAIKTLDLKGEVITTPFTFASTTHAIVNNGLTPVFCDVDPVTYNIDVNKIEELINENTCAIVAVHVFGTPCDVEKIEEIAQKHNLKVIYDAAHAFGVTVKGKPIGNYGDISMFSLHATKVFNSIEGGLLTFNDTSLKSKLSALRNFGMMENGSVDLVGLNAKMNEFQASMGLCNLETIEEDIEKRKQITHTYIENLKQVGHLQFLQDDPDVKRNYSYFPVLLKDEAERDALHEKLKDYKVFTRKYFYPLINEFPCYSQYDPKDTPVALDISHRVLCLPMYTSLELNQVKQICDIIAFELGENK